MCVTCMFEADVNALVAVVALVACEVTAVS